MQQQYPQQQHRQQHQVINARQNENTMSLESYRRANQQMLSNFAKMKAFCKEKEAQLEQAKKNFLLMESRSGRLTNNVKELQVYYK